MKPSFLIAVLFAACAAQTQTLRVVPAPLEGTGQTANSVQFFCTQDYNRDECRQHALDLRRVLMTYPLERLGVWSFALVPSYKWKDLVRSIGGPAHSPAFSIFEQRTTVMESSLFSATAPRSAEFLHMFGVTGEALLELAVNHELGHCVCHDQDERRADYYGRELRTGKIPDCGRTPKRKTDHPIKLTILVNNYSQASRAVIMAAEREAGRILGEAGVQAVWLECKVDRSTADTQELCRKPVEATDIQLRILSAPIRNQYQDAVFGFAVHPVLASVFYDYAVRLAKEDDAQFELPIVLGCVIAHEIGHLLLGADSHSGSGLMQRQWRRESVRKAMTGSLLFSAEESEVIRAEAQRRTLTPTSDTPGRDFVIIGGSDQQQRLVSCIAQASTWLFRDRSDLQQSMTFVILEHDKFLQSRAAFHAYRTKLAYSNLAIRRIYLSSRVLADRDTALWGVGHELGHFMIRDGVEGHAEFAAERIRWRARQTCGAPAH